MLKLFHVTKEKEYYLELECGYIYTGILSGKRDQNNFLCNFPGNSHLSFRKRKIFYLFQKQYLYNFDILVFIYIHWNLNNNLINESI